MRSIEALGARIVRLTTLTLTSSDVDQLVPESVFPLSQETVGQEKPTLAAQTMRRALADGEAPALTLVIWIDREKLAQLASIANIALFKVTVQCSLHATLCRQEPSLVFNRPRNFQFPENSACCVVLPHAVREGAMRAKAGPCEHLHRQCRPNRVDDRVSRLPCQLHLGACMHGVVGCAAA